MTCYEIDVVVGVKKYRSIEGGIGSLLPQTADGELSIEDAKKMAKETALAAIKEKRSS